MSLCKSCPFQTMKYLTCLIVVLLCACQPDPLVELGMEFEDDKWTYENSINFTFSAPDTINQYDLILDLEHYEAYAYENIYIHIKTVFPDGTDVTDEISIPLLGDDGQWVGKGSELKRVRVYLQQGLKFRKEGVHSITINQHSREKELEHIHSMSLAIFQK